MAFIDSLDKFNETVTGKFGSKFDAQKGAIQADSQQRNYIAETMQRMTDNEITLSDPDAQVNFESFMSLMSGRASANGEFKLGNGGLPWEWDKDHIGDDELTAMSNMMVALNEMQASGQISMAQYTDSMSELFKPETLKDLTDTSKGAFMNLCRSVGDMADKSVDDATKSANQRESRTAMPHDFRPVINGVNDYTDSVAGRRAGKPEYTTASEAKDAIYNAARDAFNADPPKIDETQYQAIQDYLQSGFGSANTNTDQGYTYQDAGNFAAAAYAFEEALSTGDPDLITTFTNRDTLKNIQSGNTAGLKTLSELDQYARQHDDAAPSAPGPSADDQVKADKDAITRGVVYMKGQGLFDEKDADGSYPGVNMLVDTMTANYFSPADGNGPGITQDEYLNQYDEYAKLDRDAQMMYLVNNPAFADADKAVNSIQRVADQMNESLGDNGNIYNMTNILYDAANDGFNNNLDSLVTAMTTIGEGKVASAEYTGDYDAEMKMEDARTLLQRDPMSSYELVVATSQEIWQGGNHYGTGWENRINAMMDKGLTREEAERVKDIVNMGYDVTSSMTQEKYDELFAEKDGGTLSERMDAYVANAEKMMTYEGGGDYMFQNNAGESSMMSYAEATKAYANAAKAVERYQEGGGELSEEVKEEAGTNLEAFIADGAKAFAENAKNADPMKASRPDIDPDKDKDDFQMQ